MNKVSLLKQDSGHVEWYTPSKYLEAARDVMGRIVLDPASDRYGNRTVQAEIVLTREMDGLSWNWDADTVWLNPPYGRVCFEGELRSAQDVWSSKLIDSYTVGQIGQAILLVHASTSSRWFWRLWDYDVCMVYHRVRFERMVGKVSAPTTGCAFVYLGPNSERFREVFSRFGACVRRAERE